MPAGPLMPAGQILTGTTRNGSRVSLSEVLNRQELEGVPTQPQWLKPQASGGVVPIGSHLRRQPHLKMLNGTCAISLRSSASGIFDTICFVRAVQITGESQGS